MNGSSNRIHMDGLRLQADVLSRVSGTETIQERNCCGDQANLRCCIAQSPHPNPPPQAGEGARRVAGLMVSVTGEAVRVIGKATSRVEARLRSRACFIPPMKRLLPAPSPACGGGVGGGAV